MLIFKGKLSELIVDTWTPKQATNDIQLFSSGGWPVWWCKFFLHTWTPKQVTNDIQMLGGLSGGA